MDWGYYPSLLRVDHILKQGASLIGNCDMEDRQLVSLWGADVIDAASIHFRGSVVVGKESLEL
jgi:hypothetical protein